MRKIIVILVVLLLSDAARADLTATEGLGIDLSSAGAGTDFTIDFDPTEILGNRTWGAGSTDTIVWTWNRATGTDPTMTFGSAALTFNSSVTAVSSFIIGGADMSEADLEKLDGVTNGTAAANKAVVLDASLDIATINSLTATTLIGALTGNADTVTTNANLTGEVTSVGNAATIADSITVTGWVLGTSSATQLTSPTIIIDLLDTTGAADIDYGSADVTDHTFISDGGTAIIDGTVTAVGSFIIGAADMAEADLEKLDGVTNGTAAANKAVVLDGSLDIATINSLTATTLVGALTGAASGNLLNSESDILVGTLTADGLTLGANENITLGAQTLDHDGTDFVFNDSVNIGANALITSVNIKSEPKHLIFNIFDPLAVQTDDGEICIWPLTPAALTVTKIEVTLDAAANEVAGDLKYADTFIGLANATVINDFDTTSGVRSDSSIASGTVASGKTIYISFDSAPNTAITQMCVDVTFDYD